MQSSENDTETRLEDESEPIVPKSEKKINKKIILLIKIILIVIGIGVIYFLFYFKNDIRGIIEEGYQDYRCIDSCPILNQGDWEVEVKAQVLKPMVLFLRNTKTDFKKAISSPLAYNIKNVSIYKNNIVWIEDSWIDNSNKKTVRTTWIYDLSTDEKNELSIRPVEFSLYKDSIVYLESNEFNDLDKDEYFYIGDNKIHMYNIETKEEKILLDKTTEVGRMGMGMGNRRTCLSVYEDVVVYRDDIFGDENSYYSQDGVAIIYMLNLKNMKITEIDRVGRISVCPVRDKNKIAYSVKSSANDSYNIFVYDTVTDEKKKITEVGKSFVLGAYRNLYPTVMYFFENELLYSKSSTFWIGPDVDTTYKRCMKVDLDSNKEKDVTCKLEKWF